jgi:hypothetical protein
MLKYQLNDVHEFLEIGENPMIVKSLHLAIRKDIPDADQILTKFNEAVKIILDKEYAGVKNGPIPQEKNAYIANITVQLNLVAKMIGK